MRKLPLTIAAVLLLLPVMAVASTGGQTIDLTTSWIGITALILFAVAYSLVIAEEAIHMRKSKPVMLAAGLIWMLVGIGYAQQDMSEAANAAIRHNLLEYTELMLFLLVAMTYINTMQERNIFLKLRAWLVNTGYSLRTIFWLTGLLAFFISPIADNLTTALIMSAVVIAVGADNTRFITISCISIVVAANAGGVFSPFGDITTLMVWQKGIIQFSEFFVLFIPALINWLIPAAIMSLVISKDKPQAVNEHVEIKHGGYVVIGLFIVTITIAVSMHNFLHMPPVVGMMLGLGLLQIYGFFIRRNELNLIAEPGTVATKGKPFDIYKSMARAEWDTLMFFYGVVLCVGGLGALGYLALVSEAMYIGLGPTWANILVGILSAIVDNIPVMFAVLTMSPEMSHGQWLLVTLTAGVGGSLLSIGSAAGVALMGQARGIYTFFSHLKWTWAIALGYAASIWTHLWLNASLM